MFINTVVSPAVFCVALEIRYRAPSKTRRRARLGSQKASDTHFSPIMHRFDKLLQRTKSL